MIKTKENFEFVSKDVFKEVSKINQSLTNTIKKAINKLEKIINEIIKSNKNLNKQNTLIKLIHRIGKQTNLHLLLLQMDFLFF